MSQFAVGDRVRISHATHPWHGSSGTITRPVHEQGLDWIVELEGAAGHTAGVADRHLRLLEKAAA